MSTEEVERLVREIHQAVKRGSDTQDHGLIGNLRCILDHVLPEPENAPAPEPVAFRVEGWHGGKLWAHCLHDTAEQAKVTAAVFAQHYTTVHTIPLYAAPAPAVPPGWKLVPVEPTPELVQRAANHGVWTDQEVRNLYADIIAAAPPAQQPVALSDDDIDRIADQLWEQGHIQSLSKDTARIFARAVLAAHGIKQGAAHG